jgi:hypothetical protein
MTSEGGNLQKAEAGAFGEHANTASANFTVGAVGFGLAWQDDEPSVRQMYESACASIVRLECEADELRAEVALAEAERIEMAKLLRSERQMHAQCQNERDELRMRLEATK